MNYTEFKKWWMDFKGKKPIAIVFVLILLIIIIGGFFGKEIVAPTFSSNLFSKQNVTPENSVASVSNQQLYFGVSTETISEDNDLYMINAEYPVFNIPILDKAIKDLIDAQITDFKESNTNGYARNEFFVDFENTYIDADIISFKLTVNKYIGGAHGMTEYFTFNCNRKTGYFYTINDLKLLTGLDLSDLEKEAVRSLEKQSERNERYPDSFDDNAGLTAKPSNYKTFTIGKDNLTFWFQEYQLLPRSAGNPSFSVKRLK